MSNANGTWFIRSAMGLAVAGIIGAVGVYAQVRSNTNDLESAKEVRKETRGDIKAITRDISDIRESQAGTQSKVDAIYDVIVKDK